MLPVPWGSLADFKVAVENAGSLEDRGILFVLLYERLAAPLVAEAQAAGDAATVFCLLEETWRIGYEAGVFDRPPLSPVD